MTSAEQLHELSLIGAIVIGPDGQKIGKFGQIFIDERSGEPAWATVYTGLFGHLESFIPLSRSVIAGDTLQVPYDKQTVKDAPNIDPEGQLSPSQEQELYHYYSLSYDEADQAAVQPGVHGAEARAEYSRENAHDPRSAGKHESAAAPGESTPARKPRLRKHVASPDSGKPADASSSGESVAGDEPSTEKERLRAQLRKEQAQTDGLSGGRQTR
ncbi:PRC-barrel domain-containing protein [Glutamicibacter sp.]|uniref:PRC-barrel domain-containing protein n=1 Tax=Glutamicibacter sp. TaxID=1931995 RepID=UPI003D6A5CA0